MKSYVLGILGVAVFVVGVIAIGMHSVPAPSVASDGYAADSKYQGTDDLKVGSVTGPDSYYQDETHNGVRLSYFNQRMRQTASTTCSFKVIATSTLVSAIAKFTLASSSATLIEWGKAATPFATTTSLGRIALAAAAQGVAVASTTELLATMMDPTFVLAPNTYLNLKVGGAVSNGEQQVAAAGFVPVGTCSAIFNVL